MLKIGEFSGLSRISIRMLRYYDEMCIRDRGEYLGGFRKKAKLEGNGAGDEACVAGQAVECLLRQLLAARAGEHQERYGQTQGDSGGKLYACLLYTSRCV